jgi:uncharacterized pyridoxal phosphate-containing UPF0001 family protein
MNREIFSKVERANAQILVVTKYFSPEKTREIFEEIKNEKSFLAVGENRSEVLAEKKLPREKVHFIGKIQSRKIPEISKFCSVIHSIEKISHAEKFIKLNPDTKIFFQIKLDSEKNSGVDPANFLEFFSEIKTSKIPEQNILGVSGMGRNVFSKPEKEKEFQILKKIRDEFFPEKKISAGTSVDFEIALEQKIEVVRVGRKCFE